MILNLIVIVLVLVITAAWMFRGAFNAFIHLLCTIAAGAVALALWEKFATMLVNMSPERGFFSFIEGMAWGIGLIVPFVVTLLVLRVITDKVVDSNIKNNDMVNYVFGGLFGLKSAIITTGIIVIAIGTMRLPSNFLGYQPIWYSQDRSTGQGSLVRNDKLWVPVDWAISVGYGKLSEGTMSTAEPLAKWYPDLELAGFANRISAGNGGARTAYTDDAFKLKSSYTIGADGSVPINDLLKDERDSVPQKYVDINNEKPAKGYLAGYIIDFNSNARERGKKGGQVMVSNGQISMIAQGDDGKTTTIFPIATISESRDGPDGRWLFDSDDVFINSVGGKTTVTMGFEFIVPTGYTPIGLTVKGVRVPLDEASKPNEIKSVAARDRSIRSGSLLKGEKGASKKLYNQENTQTVDGSTNPVNGARASVSVGEVMSTTAAKSAGFTLIDDNTIGDGEGKLDPETQLGRKNTPTDRKLRIDKFAIGANQQLIQVDVSPDQPGSLLGDAARFAKTDVPIKLVDTNGDEYEAIGFVYEDDTIMHIRYTNGSTLKGLDEVPPLSTSRIGEQKLRMLFIVTQGVDIEYFVIGDDAIVRFSPPLPALSK
ncbi:MAG: CvpA family protein [Phycisphaerales bacterium]|nr:CvpA family protein [Phycisphaerales bacterium]